jgi:glycosyltransferase involved in cell wall biosynthesis
MNIAAIILSFNEEKHIARCIESLKDVAKDVYVVDCGSSDKTVQIAQSMGAKVLTNKWLNHATQLRWAIKNINSAAEWVIRLDADEYLSDILKHELKSKLAGLNEFIDGVAVKRKIIFQGKQILFGGVGSIYVLRVFRNGHAYITDRWMDEHIYVKGNVTKFRGEIFDDNLNHLTWWINKHNNYANYEAFEILRLKYKLFPKKLLSLRAPLNVIFKKAVKENLYLILPKGYRAFIYFFYRYFFLLGFLDGYIGFIFHFNQAFWYRALVDSKVAEVENYRKKTGKTIEDCIFYILNIKVKKNG